jgi:hypothetical protein
MKKFGTPNGAAPGDANENVGLEGVGTPLAVNGGGGCGGVDGDPPPCPLLEFPGELPVRPGLGVGERNWPVVVSPVPVEGWDPLGVDRDEPELPVVGRGVGGLDVLEVVDVLEVEGVLRVGDGTLTDGTLTDGTVTDGTVTDGTFTDGTLTDGSGDDESAGGTAIAVIAPNTPAPIDAASTFLPKMDGR